MPKRLTETTPLSEAGSSLSKSGRMKVHAITAGLGSSGYYSPAVIQEAATNGLIAKGTPLFLDHPSETDRHDRPERSVKDIAAVFTESATYDATEEALVGEIQVFAPYRDLLTEMAPYIGLSISGSATDITEGEVDGKRVPVIESLSKIDSVDWVTRAGRGGKVVELFESARVNKRALDNGIAEATVNDTREQLQAALRDTYGGEKTYVWVRDFDETTVWFEVEQPDSASGLYAQAYDGDPVALSGDRTEVRAQTTYVPVSSTTRENDPVARPGSTTTEESTKEDTMGKIQIEEAEHSALVEKAGRVDALTTERDTEKTRADNADVALAEHMRQTAALRLVAEHQHTFTPLEVKGLLTDLPVAESGDLDAEAFGKTLDEAATAATPPAAGIHGMGATTDNQKVAEDATVTRTAWGRPLTEQKGA